MAAGGLAGLAPGLADDVRVVAQVSRYLLSMSIRFYLQYLQPPVSPHHGPRAHVPVPGSQQRGLAPLVRCDTWHVTRDTWRRTEIILKMEYNAVINKCYLVVCILGRFLSISIVTFVLSKQNVLDLVLVRDLTDTIQNVMKRN